MIKGYIIRVAKEADLPEIADLAKRAKLVKSRPPDEMDERMLRNWLNPDVVFSLVACSSAQPRRVVASAEVHSLGTPARNQCQLENVATDPEHVGRGLAKAVVGGVFWHAQMIWKVRQIIWTSEEVEGRILARDFYTKTLGAKIVPGTISQFSVHCPWQPPEKMQPHFIDCS